MKKSLILLMYSVVVYFILRKWYAQGNTGIPNPQILVGPTYLYGILALSADFADNLPIVIGAGMTFAFILQAQSQPSKIDVNPATNPKAAGPIKPSINPAVNPKAAGPIKP